MKKSLTLSIISSLFIAMTFISGCSKKASVTPKTFDENLLLGAKWTTTSAFITKTDGSTLNLQSSDPLIASTLIISDLTFYTLPTASDLGRAGTDDFGPFVRWTYTEAISNLNLVFLNTPVSVNATITKLDAHTLVLHRTNNLDDGGDYKIIDQTFTR